MTAAPGHQTWLKRYLRWLAFGMCAVPAFFLGWTLVEMQIGPMTDRLQAATYAIPGFIAALVAVIALMRRLENWLRGIYKLPRVQDEHGLSTQDGVNDPLADAAEQTLEDRLREELKR